MPDRSTSHSFAVLLQRYFTEHLTNQRAVSPQTIAAYRDTFRLLLSFAERHIGKNPASVELGDLDSELILAFLDHLERERNNGPRSRNVRLSAIRSFLRYALHYDVSALSTIQRALAIPQKRYDKPLIGFLSREEWTGRRDRAFFTTMYNTGARVSELIGLRVSDVVLDGSACIHITGKGRKQRTVPLWRTSANLLRAWKREIGVAAVSAAFFPNRDGLAMTRSNVTQRLALYVKQAAQEKLQLLEKTISPHTFRHTTAMHLLQSGVDIAVIALWLGHESPTTTHMYIEADLSMKERALGRLQPLQTGRTRYRPPDVLMQFLQAL
jgi:integrase/recombinase XerD